MATSNAGHSRPEVAIAPAPALAPDRGGGRSDNEEDSRQQASMPYTCQTCARRKVKCDKATPVCSTCHRCGLDCFYQAPVPRSRKRKPVNASSDVLEKLDRYEAILRRHGLLEAPDLEKPSALGGPEGSEEPVEDPIFPLWNIPPGKPGVDPASSRYINSHMWRNLGEEGFQRLTNDEEADEGDDELDAKGVSGLSSQGVLEDRDLDPLSGALMFTDLPQSLLQYHPPPATAAMLWNTHVENVEPLCKVLHIPSTAKMVQLISQQPEQASRADECLLFAVYHSAVSSMTEEACVVRLGQTRDALLLRYHLATRRALINASFLKTTAMPVLQALVLFLLACRYTHAYDVDTYWILTGVASRIAQRMGLHRDGEKLNLPPFEVQMRRRLFYQILPLEGTASRMCGIAVSLPDVWDTKLPLNVNDDQIWPGMTETPLERTGATEMIFCLARACLGTMLAKAGKGAAATGDPDANAEKREMAIRESEREIEDKYVRYCDIASPLHLLTLGSARAGIAAMRLRARLVKVKDGTASDAERRELFQLAEKILDTDAATRSTAVLDRFRWHVKGFFLWGMWDSIIYVLMTLWQRSDLLTPAEIDAAWRRLEQVCLGHETFLDSKQQLYLACGRLMLKAWGSRSVDTPEPEFIVTLRDRHASGVSAMKTRARQQKESSSAGTLSSNLDSELGAREAILPLGSSPDPFGPSGMIDFGLDETDWTSWDQLLQGPLT